MISTGPFTKTVNPDLSANAETTFVLASSSSGRDSPKSLSNSLAWGVTTVLVFLIDGRTCGRRASASTTIDLPSPFISFKACARDSGFCGPRPGPMAKVSTWGTHDMSLETLPRVSLESGRGTTMKSGESALIGVAIDAGTARNTKSTPDLIAPIAHRKGAPWYSLLPPTTQTVPFIRLWESFLLGGMTFATYSASSRIGVIL